MSEPEIELPPADPLWMETEEIGLSDRWMWSLIAFAVPAIVLVFIVLPLLL